MRTILKKVYYCDFCKKKGLNSLVRHEKYCTGNPNRECRMCADGRGGNTKDKIREAIKKLKETYPIPSENTYGGNADIKFLYTIIEDCPACILSVLRQSGLMKHYSFEFEYKKEVEKFWNVWNAEIEEHY